MRALDPASVLDGLNSPQRLAAETVEGPLVILAGAGVGKTRTIAARTAHIIGELGVHASRVCLMTFTNKAAGEMKARIEKMLSKERVRHLWSGTFHSLCGRLLRMHAPLVGRTRDFAVYDDDDQRVVVRQVVEEMGLKKEEWNADALSERIALKKQAGLCPDNIVADGEHRGDTFVEIWRGYERGLLASNAMDFEDMILLGLSLVERQDEVGESLRSKFDYVMVDEFQDTNKTQYALAKALASNGNLCVVGDDNQCLVPGTRIMVAGKKTVAVETLRNGDLVISWNRNAQRMVSQCPVRVGRRAYSGPILTVRTDLGREVRVTPEHRFLCRYTDRTSKECATYLMWRKGFGFRVGWCQLFYGSKALHIGQRTRLERADKAWILKVFPGRAGASIYESVVAAKYGLATATFEPIPGSEIYNKEGLRRLFDAVGKDTFENGIRTLRDHGRDFDIPLYPYADRSIRKRRCTYIHVNACNLLPGVMSVPAPDGQNEWQQIVDVSSKFYRGYVHSLEIKPHETYSANGVVTHNSIYSWRGAVVKYIRSFADDFPGAKLVKLEQNYRSTKRIISVAQAVIDKCEDEDQIKKSLWTENQTGTKVSYLSATNEYEEAAFVVDQMCRLQRAGHPLTEMAVLYRSHVQSRAIEEQLIGNKIPYRMVGGFGFYDRKEVKGLLGYLRLCVNPDSDVDLLRIVNLPPRGIGAGTVKRLKDAARSQRTSLWAALPAAEAKDGVRPRERDMLSFFRGLIEKMRCVLDDEEVGPSEFLGRLIEASGYKRYWQDTSAEAAQNGKLKKSEEEQERAANCDSLIEGIAAYERGRLADGEVPTVAGYLDLVSLMTKEKERSDEEEQKVSLLTIHAAKGLEFDYVWLVGAEDGKLPSGRSEDKDSYEEERRLAYVAVTRARRQLWVSWAMERMKWGTIEYGTPSPFFEHLAKELPEAFVEMTVKEYWDLQRQILRGGAESKEADRWTIDQPARI